MKRILCRAGQRGMSLLESMVALSLTAGILGTAMGVYVSGTKGLYQEQGQSYVQSRARQGLDNIARDARSAKAFVASATVNGVAYTANDGSTGDACLILQVPAQDSQTMDLLYYNSGAQATTLVTDTVVYYFKSRDHTLRRTISPGGPITINGVSHSSFRTSITDAVMTANLSGLTFKMRDRDGAITTQPGRVAAVDMVASLTQGSGGTAVGAVALTGVRLRNMRSGTISGTIVRASVPVAGAVVQAIFNSDTGVYAAGTVVGSATTAADGSFQIFGLDAGTYSLKVTALTTTTKDGFVVPDEDACNAGTITIL
jgi:type II secretory pathway pseudopilin PulG